ncbi:hypothetical protein DB32_004000 [Sandaracinus amylolyticus]|uniref:Uncharacterized protein n=1 Tax=Sandaracinus amylolyticus TaxID=927083 RepID=A0A0F6YIL9_9BACT|nr:hypothetical protein DB32_004000 [Sandaracinus amylolyticus]
MAITLSLSIAGCYDWRRGVTETASVQHSCPPERIRILNDNGNGFARTVQMDVCGERRVYQDVGGAQGFVWVDQTPVSAGGESAPRATASAPPPRSAPPPATTSISTQSESPFATTVRARLQDRASAIVTCTGGPVAIQARWAPTSPTVELAARGVSDPAVAQCIGAVVGAIEVPAGTPAGELLHPITN